MTKNEIIAEILAKPFVNKMVSLVAESTMQDGTILYNMNVLETVGNSGKISTYTFYVINEGLAGESAYYKDAEPLTSKVQTFMSKVKPLLAQYNGVIKEQGDTWCLAEANIVKTGTPNTILKENYFIVDGENLTITKIG